MAKNKLWRIEIAKESSMGIAERYIGQAPDAEQAGVKALALFGKQLGEDAADAYVFSVTFIGERDF